MPGPRDIRRSRTLNAHGIPDHDVPPFPFPPPDAREGKCGQGTLEPRRIVLIAFDSLPLDLLGQMSADRTLIISETPHPGFDWRPIESALDPADLDQAVRLLKELNTLVDESGTPYRSAVRYHGYEPWWFHQQAAFDEYLAHFIRYLPLLAACREAARVIIVDCPYPLRRIFPLIHRRVEMHWRSVKPSRLRRIRRAASGAFYRIVTAIAIAHATVRRPPALVYTVDGIDGRGRNRWIDGLYQALRRRNTSFLEIAWSDSGARALRRWRVRPRLVAYAQAVASRDEADPRPDWPRAATHDGELVQSFLHSLARNVLVPAAQRSVRSIRRYESLLRLTRAAGVYLMDDYVHAFELVVACRRRGVPTVALQHGQFNRYTAGLMGYGFDGERHHSYDRYCVWNDYFAQLLVLHSRLVPADSVVVAGSPRARAETREVTRPRVIECDRGRANADAGTAREHGSWKLGRPPPPAHVVGPRVLFLAEHYDASSQQEVDAYERALAVTDIELWLKTHPSTAKQPARAPAYPGREPRAVDAPLDELLARVDVVVASYSSAIFEAILHMKPVVLFSTSRYRDPHGLAEAGLASHATSAEEITELVWAATRLPQSELMRRRERVWGPVARSNDAGETAVIEMNMLRHVKR